MTHGAVYGQASEQKEPVWSRSGSEIFQAVPPICPVIVFMLDRAARSLFILAPIFLDDGRSSFWPLRRV
jgi:hypothetical protein